jgi:hypothetical protein
LSTPPSPRPRPWRRYGLLLAAPALAILASVGADDPPGAFAVDARPVDLNPADPGQTRVGALRYRGGLWLRSSDARFGGLSGLQVSADGRRLVAVSDCGRSFVADLEYDRRGHLAGIGEATLRDLVGPGGRALGSDEIDAEGLAPDGAGGLLVAFEAESPRIWRYRADPALAGPAEPGPAPPFGSECGENHGPEALSGLADGRLFVACEGAGLWATSTTAWLGRDAGGWTHRPYPLDRREATLGEVFRPTDAALLPDGDLLVLERRFPPIQCRVMHLARADLEGEGPLAPRELARLESPLTVDNFEGLAVRRDAAGKTLLYLVTDDNGCGKAQVMVAPSGLQRTLLLLFELLPGEEGGAGRPARSGLRR